MARQTLFKHKKFTRAVAMLKAPAPHLVGYLEFLWSVAYESGDPEIGDAADVERAAGYRGKKGKLFEVLLNCGGGPGRPGFIEEIEGNPGRYQIHDLFDHAPQYVQARAKHEAERKRKKICDGCGGTYSSPDVRSKFCSDACRQRAYRERHGQCVTESNTALRNGDGALQNVTTLPHPHPSLSISTGEADEVEQRVEASKEAAIVAVNEWAAKAIPIGQGRPIEPMWREDEKIKKTLRELVDRPDIPRGRPCAGHREIAVPFAVRHLIDKKMSFQTLDFALGCIRNAIDTLANTGSCEGRATPPRRNGQSKPSFNRPSHAVQKE